MVPLVSGEFRRHFVGDNPPVVVRGCCFSPNPPTPFLSENSLRWEVPALSAVFPFRLGIDWFGEAVGWMEMQRCLLSLTGMVRAEPHCV